MATGHTSPGLCQHSVHHSGFVAVDLCINTFERQLSFLFGKETKLLPPPLSPKLQKANEGLINGGIEVERKGKNDGSGGISTRAAEVGEQEKPLTPSLCLQV